jgi:hypothetical protein
MSPSTDSRENREFASEMKFLVSPPIADQIRDWVRAKLAPDPNAAGEARDTYRITSLYFDTPRFDVFHRKGSFGRSKYRIRRYGASEVAFLERKLRTRGLLAKRRSLVKLDELDRLTGFEPDRDWVGYWFHRRLQKRELAPICQISYLRTARVAMTKYGPIRVTLDNDLRAQSVAGLAFGDQPGELILPNWIILEMKFRYEMPALFKNLAEEFALTARPFSKYRLGVASLGVVSDTEAVETLKQQYA